VAVVRDVAEECEGELELEVLEKTL